MASADPYGLVASGLDPELAAQLVGLQGRQAIAQALMQQSIEPLQSPQNKGDLSAAISPFAALAKVLQAPLARMAVDKTNKGYADLAAEAVKRRTAALDDYQRTRDGTPGTPASSVPYTDTLGGEAPTPDIQTPGTAGQPGNARAAIMRAMLNPMLANNPVVQADMKKLEPNWKDVEIYDQKSGQKQKMLVNMNDPTQAVTFGGVQKKIAQVTAAGPDGAPVTKFVVEDANAEPIAQPVKKEMVNTGKAQVPVNPYNPEPLANTTSPNSDQSAGVAIRGQNMHRETALQTHGLGPDGSPTGDIVEVAKAIAEGRLPPLSSFAMASPRGQMIMSEVTKANPNYDVKDFHAADQAVKAFASGKQGNTVRSFNVALSHLDTLDRAADALNNGDMKAMNAVSQAIASQTGQAAPTNFDAVKKIVGDEIVKAIVGSGGGVADREEASKTIARTNSPAQLKGVIGQYKELMRGQLGGLRQQYEVSTGRKDFDRLLSEQGKTAAHVPDANTMHFDAQGNLVQ